MNNVARAGLDEMLDSSRKFALRSSKFETRVVVFAASIVSIKNKLINDSLGSQRLLKGSNSINKVNDKNHHERSQNAEVDAWN